ncbi:NfeD family protein [Sphingomonas sp.]|uniref:NfeD family protein n=1 Tax=Sphingomonas sp. TaxID=28214 RepID=UPI002D0C5D0B|nr:NfeD family protein [Sphingomonas sp.]HTG39701.1 NfeD family protein [Sphingomonas sp.]
MLDWLAEPGALWLFAAAMLAGIELAVPGVFLVFLAVAAAITGVFTLLFPDLGLGGQLGSFAVWSAVSVAIGRRWYGGDAIVSSDPMLNDRAARIVGATVVAVTDFDGGTGRVRLGDGEWPAHGPDMPIGTRARVTALDGLTLIVEPLNLPPVSE